MTKSEINLMLHNFEATVPWRNIYRHPVDNTGKIIELIKAEIASGNNMTTNILKAVNSSIKIQQREFAEIISDKTDELWTVTRGKFTTRFYHLIEGNG
jgi:kynureninase